MSKNAPAFSLGRAIGAPLAPFLYHFGFPANVVGTVVFDLAALLVLKALQRAGD